MVVVIWLKEAIAAHPEWERRYRKAQMVVALTLPAVVVAVAWLVYSLNGGR